MQPPDRVTGQAFTPKDALGPLNDVQLRHAPKKLFLSGWPGLLLERHRFAVMGSREASGLALRRAAAIQRLLEGPQAQGPGAVRHRHQGHRKQAVVVPLPGELT